MIRKAKNNTKVLFLTWLNYLEAISFTNLIKVRKKNVFHWNAASAENNLKARKLQLSIFSFITDNNWSKKNN